MTESELTFVPENNGEEIAGRLTRARKTYTRLGAALFLIAVCTLVLQILLGVLTQIFADKGYAFVSSGWYLWVATFVPLYLIGIPAGLLVMRKAPREEKEKIKLGGKNFFVFLLMCFPLMYGGNLIGTLLSSLLSGGTAQNGLMELAFDESPVRILVLVVLAPLLEEYVFRKQLIDRAARFGEKPVMLFSALTFGLFHMNLFQFFYAFALGLIFAYVYTRTRRLRYSVAMHMIINAMGSVLAPWLLSRGGLDAINQMSSGQLDEAALMTLLPALVPFMLYTFAIIGLSIAGLVLLIVKARKLVFLPASEEIPKEKSFQTVYLNVGVILFVVLCAVMFVVALL